MAEVIQVDEVINAKEGDLRVWWIRNAPSPAEFHIAADVADAKIVLKRLAERDMRDSRVVSNASGLEVFEGGEWHEWYDENGVDIAGFIADQEV